MFETKNKLCCVAKTKMKITNRPQSNPDSNPISHHDINHQKINVFVLGNFTAAGMKLTNFCQKQHYNFGRHFIFKCKIVLANAIQKSKRILVLRFGMSNASISKHAKNTVKHRPKRLAVFVDHVA